MFIFEFVVVSSVCCGNNFKAAKENLLLADDYLLQTLFLYRNRASQH